MKSIKEHQCYKSNLTLQNILGQSLWYARCSILSISLMSGFGLPWNYDDSRVNDWLSVIDYRDIKNIIPENIVLLRAVYKKGTPGYYNAYNGNCNDYQNYLWDDSTFKRIITPTAQSYLIMDEIALAKYLYRCSEAGTGEGGNAAEKKLLSLLLMNSAIIQAEFMSNYLRNPNGLFVSKEDKSQNPYGQPLLEDTDKSPAVSEQALAMEAFSLLSGALDDPSYPLFQNAELSSLFGKYAREVYNMFHDSHEDIFQCKTKELCNVISSAIEYFKLMPHDGSILDYITMLSLELESRIDMSGNVLRYPDEASFTSNSSCFMALKALIQSYRVTDIYKFLSCSSLLYKKLSLLWEPSSSLYALDDEKFKYTLRDVGSVLGGLNAVRLFGEKMYMEDAENKLISFFDSGVNASGLIQSSFPPPGMDDCEAYIYRTRNNSESIAYEDFISPGIPQSLECGVAPVFAKKFTYKQKKKKFSINSSSFYSDYALYTINEMLCMNYPLIDCFYNRETTCSSLE